jgi:hypothetical protein
VEKSLAPPARPAAKTVAELIGPSLDPLVRKRGLARAELISWWPDIVGETYAGRTVPERIKWARDGKAATLVVRCDPSVALQFSYETEQVRERLNTYFGYSAVGAVRIVQHRVGGEGKPVPAATAEAELPAELESRLVAVDGPLRDSLRTLGRHVLAGSS